MTSKTYRGLAVHRVEAGRIGLDRKGQALTLGVDVGKYRLVVVGRWPDATVEKPWKVANPEQLPDLMALLQQLRQQGHSLTVPGQILIAFVPKLKLYGFWRGEGWFAEFLKILENQGVTGLGVGPACAGPNSDRICSQIKCAGPNSDRICSQIKAV